MNEIARLVKTLKHRLKIQGMTYRDLALALNVSEPSVKRMFALPWLTVSPIGFAELSKLVSTATPAAAAHV